MPKSRDHKPNQIRIISGNWKGRKLPVSETAHLRPTPNRLRVTLFNWLRPYLPGAACLDLFAGTGALGFEAVSNGAQRCVLVETDKRAYANLASSAKLLDNNARCEVVRSEANEWLANTAAHAFDIVFLDPPFDAPDLLATSLTTLRNKTLAKNFIYVEATADNTIGELATDLGLAVVRQSHAGASHAYLLQVAR